MVTLLSPISSAQMLQHQNIRFPKLNINPHLNQNDFNSFYVLIYQRNLNQMFKKSKKPFDFTKHKQRHVALKILYFGWDYDGLAAQQDSEATIEFHLFQALIRTCLVESRDKCNFNRCGRTDKGVSSYGQVVNLDIRSNLVDESNPQNIGLFTPENYQYQLERSCNANEQERQELDYVSILNRVLPDHIKIIAWSPVKRETFSSRFKCKSRSYSYIFPAGDLSIELMQKAMEYLVGEHDFRNMCSYDLKHNVFNHKRTIMSAKIEPLKNLDSTNHSIPQGQQYLFYQAVIVGQAFLYHQIRCIMTILFLVGTRKEHPEIVRDLLDLEKCPARPNYNLASPVPLCLFDCQYNPEDLPCGWLYDTTAIFNLYRQLKKLWLSYKLKSIRIEQVMLDIQSMIDTRFMSSKEEASEKRQKLELSCWKDFGLECDNMSDVKYIPLLKRPRDEPLELKLSKLEERRKLKVEEGD